MESVELTIEPFAQIRDWSDNFWELLDPDVATGAQLDVIGIIVGATRHLRLPLTDIFFEFDNPDLGFDQGLWWDKDNVSYGGLVTLPDEFFRLVIKCAILRNRWDGTKDGLYDLAEVLFSPFGMTYKVVDNGDLTIDIILEVPVGGINPTIQDILDAGVLDIKPITVEVASRSIVEV